MFSVCWFFHSWETYWKSFPRFVGVTSTLSVVKAGEERDAVPPGLPSGFLTRHGTR